MVSYCSRQSIKVLNEMEGADEAEAFRGLNGIANDIAPVELQKWWDRILTTAKQICNDPEGKLINSEVILAQKKDDEVKAQETEKGRDCMRKAIEQHLNSMPNITQEIFIQILENFRNKNHHHHHNTTVT
jgi:hypothetical protein